MGYTSNDKERYVFIDSLDYSMMNLEGQGDAAKQIIRHAVTCLNDSHWYKAEMLDWKSKGDFHTYKFKFHWVLDSRIVYVDLNGNQLSCRDGR